MGPGLIVQCGVKRLEDVSEEEVVWSYPLKVVMLGQYLDPL